MQAGALARLGRPMAVLAAALVWTGALVAPAEAAPEWRAADGGAKIVTEQWLDARTVDVTVSTPSLDTQEKVRMLLPKNWSRTAARTWPVVYAFQGGNDDYTSWTRSSTIEELSLGWDVMVVMPEAGNNGAYTDWFNYGKGGTPKWETFHTRDVTQLVERNYRGGTSRATLGISSGASGAIGYAARNPGQFRYAAAFSGLQRLTKTGLPPILMVQGLAFGFDPFRIWGVPGLHDANWKAHDPYEMAGKLRGTGLYIASGTNGLPGEFDPVPGSNLSNWVLGSVGELLVGVTNVDFANRLKQLGVPATVNLYGSGWHNWHYWQRELAKAWPPMMKSLGAEQV